MQKISHTLHTEMNAFIEATYYYLFCTNIPEVGFLNIDMTLVNIKDIKVKLSLNNTYSSLWKKCTCLNHTKIFNT